MTAASDACARLLRGIAIAGSGVAAAVYGLMLGIKRIRERDWGPRVGSTLDLADSRQPVGS